MDPTKFSAFLTQEEIELESSFQKLRNLKEAVNATRISRVAETSKVCGANEVDKTKTIQQAEIRTEEARRKVADGQLVLNRYVENKTTFKRPTVKKKEDIIQFPAQTKLNNDDSRITESSNSDSSMAAFRIPKKKLRTDDGSKSSNNFKNTDGLSANNNKFQNGSSSSVELFSSIECLLSENANMAFMDVDAWQNNSKTVNKSEHGQTAYNKNNPYDEENTNTKNNEWTSSGFQNDGFGNSGFESGELNSDSDNIFNKGSVEKQEQSGFGNGGFANSGFDSGGFNQKGRNEGSNTFGNRREPDCEANREQNGFVNEGFANSGFESGGFNQNQKRRNEGRITFGNRRESGSNEREDKEFGNSGFSGADGLNKNFKNSNSDFSHRRGGGGQRNRGGGRGGNRGRGGGTCNNFSRFGSCKFGDNCKFSHIRDENVQNNKNGGPTPLANVHFRSRERERTGSGFVGRTENPFNSNDNRNNNVGEESSDNFDDGGFGNGGFG